MATHPSEDPSPFSRSQSRSDPLTRHEQIARVAYRRAEERGFVPGGELEDWLSAEREIDIPESGPRADVPERTNSTHGD